MPFIVATNLHSMVHGATRTPFQYHDPQRFGTRLALKIEEEVLIDAAPSLR